MDQAQPVAEAIPEAGVRLDELIGLFVGDEDSCGYAHAALVVAICEQTNPTTLGELRRVLYPAGSPGDDAVDEIISWGFDRWRYRCAFGPSAVLALGPAESGATGAAAA